MTDLSLWATEEARKLWRQLPVNYDAIRYPSDVDKAEQRDIALIATALTSAILKGQEERWIKIEGEPDTSKAPWDEGSILICHAATRPHCVAAAYYEPSKKFPEHPWRVEDSEHRYHRNWPTHWMPLPAHPPTSQDGGEVMAISPDLERLARAAYAEGRRSLELIYDEMDERGKDQWRNIVRAVLEEMKTVSPETLRAGEDGTAKSGCNSCALDSWTAMIDSILGET